MSTDLRRLTEQSSRKLVEYETLIARLDGDLALLIERIEALRPGESLLLNEVVKTAPPWLVDHSGHSDAVRRLTCLYDTRRFRLAARRDEEVARNADLQIQLTQSERPEVTHARRVLAALRPEELSALIAEFM